MELRESPTRGRSSLLRHSVWGVRSWLLREWRERVTNPDLQVVTTTSYEGERLIKLFTNTESGEAFPLPWCVLVPTQISPSSGRFNSFALQKLGIRTGFSADRRTERREKVKPVDVGLGVKFVTRDVEEALMFAQIWAENSPDARIEVKQRSTGYRFGITLVPDANVDIPQQAEGSGNLEVMTTLIVNTFCGTTELNKVITKVGHSIFDGAGPSDDPDNDLELVYHERDGFKVPDPSRLRNLQRW